MNLFKIQIKQEASKKACTFYNSIVGDHFLLTLILKIFHFIELRVVDSGPLSLITHTIKNLTQ